MRAIIIEDEESAQDLLSSILREFCPSIKILGIAESVDKGISIIEKHKPDLVFLDIEISGGNSFQILDAIVEKTFKIIFTTAYDQYAIKAFEYETLQFLLKPYSPEQVLAAVNLIFNNAKMNTYENVLRKILKEKKSKDRITVTTSEGISIFKVTEIIRVEANSSYCIIYQTNGKSLLVSCPVKDIELLLPPNLFYRVHNSHLVNIDFVSRIITDNGGQVELISGKLLPLARRRKADFLKFLSE